VPQNEIKNQDMKKTQPYLIIISGPNGAGKTTFHNRIITQNPFLSNAIFLNYDNEIARLKQLPEYCESYSLIIRNMHEQIQAANTAATITFKKQMEQIAGTLNERITQAEKNKKYWHEQYRIFTHIPAGNEHIKENLYSKTDLMKNIGGHSIHDRINAKANGQNWYPKYQQMVHNLEIQKTIIVNTHGQLIDDLNTKLYRQAVANLRNQSQTAFSNKQNVIFETTSLGGQIKKLAIKHGYQIYGLHICVFRPEISVARVKHRVMNGGHDIPKNIIYKRYADNITLLPNALPTENIAVVIDNSTKKSFTPIFALSDGHVTNFSTCPEYLAPTHATMTTLYPERSVKDLLSTDNTPDIKKMTDEQRENFNQLIITKLLSKITAQYINTYVKSSFMDKIKQMFANKFSHKK